MLDEGDGEVVGVSEGIGGLHAEVERLTVELQEANEEKLQAARYGLAVLEESAALKSKHSQLEEEHEALKLELQELREVSEKRLTLNDIKRYCGSATLRQEFIFLSE